MTGLFEGWHIVLLLVVALLIFGSKRLPGAARSLGQSLRIFKTETSGLRNPGDPEGSTPPQAAAPQPLPAPQPTVNSATAATPAPETQPTNQSS